MRGGLRRKYDKIICRYTGFSPEGLLSSRVYCKRTIPENEMKETNVNQTI